MGVLTVTREVEGSSVDEQGNLVASVGSVSSTGWVFAPGSPVEQPDRVDVTGSLYGPFGADVRAGDLVTFDGVTYAVLGVPEQWEPKFGSMSVAGCRVLVGRRE